MRFGEELKEHRESRGISLDDVSISTRVSRQHLSALEEGRFRELPGGVFSRGIVRSYAQFCGLEPHGTVKGFLDAMRASGIETEQKDDDWIVLAEAVRRNRTVTKPQRRLQWLGVILMVLVVLLLAAGVLWFLLERGSLHLSPRLLDLLHRSRM